MWKGEQSICIYVKGVLCGRENKVFVFMLKVDYVVWRTKYFILVEGLLCGRENKVFVFMLKLCYVKGRTKYLYSC